MNSTADFGSRSPPKGTSSILPRLAWGGVAAMFVVTGFWDLANQHRVVAQSTADTNVAAIVGPPCPTLSRADFDSRLKLQGKLPWVFEFNGDTYGRYFGYADCSVSESQGGLGVGSYNVCQFTSPATLDVKTARGEFYFMPGVGHKATVMTEGGVAKCVMAAPAEANLTG